MALDLNKLRAEAANTAPDLTKPQSGGGGDYTPPEKGPTRLRLVGYVETGIHTKGAGPAKKTKPRVRLFFELSGPKHAPKKLDDGRLLPHRIKVDEVLSAHEKANLIKLFNTMNCDGDAKNFLDMLMVKAWRGMVSHYEFAAAGGQKRTIAQLRGKGQGYQIFPCTFEDPESGETRTVSVGPAVSEPQVFLWDYADLEQWDSVDKFTKEYIKKAENFVGSPIYEALIEAGREAETVPAQDGEQEQAEPDGDDAGGETETPPAEEPKPEPPKAAAKKAPAKAPAGAAKAPKAAAKGKAPADDADPLAGLD